MRTFVIKTDLTLKYDVLTFRFLWTQNVSSRIQYSDCLQTEKFQGNVLKTIKMKNRLEVIDDACSVGVVGVFSYI